MSSTSAWDGTPFNGPIGLAFDGTGRLFTAAGPHSWIQRFDGPGGNAGSPSQQSNTSGYFHNAFDNSGHLFATQRDTHSIVQLDPDTLQVVNTWTGPTSFCPNGLAVDPVSNTLFVTANGGCQSNPAIMRVALSAPVSGTGTLSASDYATVKTTSTLPYPDGIAFAPDGTLYATGHTQTSSPPIVQTGGAIWRVSGTSSPSPGTVQQLPNNIPGTHVAIGPGPSGAQALYVNVANDVGASNGRITRVDLPSDAETDLLTGTATGESLSFGPGGCLFATQTASILRITNLDGTCGPPSSPGSTTPTTTGGNPGIGLGGPAPVFAAVVSHATETNQIWREGNAAVQISAKRAPVGTTFRFNLNKPAAIRLDFTQPGRGRKVNGKCVAQTKKNKKKRRCTRTLVRGTLTFFGHAGVNTVKFQGRISKSKKLKPGKYTLVITATTPGAGSTSQKLTFRIVK